MTAGLVVLAVIALLVSAHIFRRRRSVILPPGAHPAQRIEAIRQANLEDQLDEEE